MRWRGLMALAAVFVGGAAPAADDAPRLVRVFTIDVAIGPPQEMGTVDGRRDRFIPITGGTVRGPRLSGVVLPGGGDWQSVHPDGLTEVSARYAVRASDGTVIDILNTGVRTAEPAVLARMLRGEAVPPTAYYFRTNPRFRVADGPHAWLRRTLFVARGVRQPDRVTVDVFAVE